MTVASFVASQRTDHGVPVAVACRALEVSDSWFYKWRDRPPTPAQERRGKLDVAVREFFDRSGGTYGSPRVFADLVEAGWAVSEKTVAASMARQGLVGRPEKRRKGLTRPDKAAVPFTDHLKRDFTAVAPNAKWCGDITEVPTWEGKLYLADVMDLYSRRVVGFSISEHPDAELATAALRFAVVARGGDVRGVIFHSDRGSTYTAERFTKACKNAGVTQSMGRVGSCFDNAAAESFFSTLEHELLSRKTFSTKQEARRQVAAWIDNYNSVRRHSTCGMRSPIDFEKHARMTEEAA
jgi:putative transposase